MTVLIVAGVLVVASMGGVSAAWIATSRRIERWIEHRTRVRAWRWALRDLHSGHIDNLPRTGGPPDGDATDPRPHLP